MLKACNSEVFKNYTSFDHTCNQGIWCTEWPPCLKSLDFGGYPAALRIQSQKLFVTVLYTCKQKRRSMEGKENKTHQCQFGLNMTNFVLTSMSSGSLPKFFIWYWGRSLLIWSCKPGNNKKNGFEDLRAASLLLVFTHLNLLLAWSPFSAAPDTDPVWSA